MQGSDYDGKNNNGKRSAADPSLTRRGCRWPAIIFSHLAFSLLSPIVCESVDDYPMVCSGIAYSKKIPEFFRQLFKRAVFFSRNRIFEEKC